MLTWNVELVNCPIPLQEEYQIIQINKFIKLINFKVYKIKRPNG